MLERIEKEMAKVAGILGKKVGMTQLFDSKGDVRPATVLHGRPQRPVRSQCCGRLALKSSEATRQTLDLWPLGRDALCPAFFGANAPLLITTLRGHT